MRFVRQLLRNSKSSPLLPTGVASTTESRKGARSTLAMIQIDSTDTIQKSKPLEGCLLALGSFLHCVRHQAIHLFYFSDSQRITPLHRGSTRADRHGVPLDIRSWEPD